MEVILGLPGKNYERWTNSISMMITDLETLYVANHNGQPSHCLRSFFPGSHSAWAQNQWATHQETPSLPTQKYAGTSCVGHVHMISLPILYVVYSPTLPLICDACQHFLL